MVFHCIETHQGPFATKSKYNVDMRKWSCSSTVSFLKSPLFILANTKLVSEHFFPADFLNEAFCPSKHSIQIVINKKLSG